MPPLLRALRPRQWSKNLVVFIGLAFSGHASDTSLLIKAAIVFACFSMAASAIYLLNDLMDCERDRAHPLKRHRMIASGAVSSTAALTASAVLASAALLVTWTVLPAIMPAISGYIVLQILYSVRLKHVVILDVFCIATGFLLRVLAGVWAIGVPLSPWLVVCSVEIALFLALCKRRAELFALGENTSTRPALGKYAGSGLDLMIAVVSSSCVVTYALYTLLPSTLLQLDVVMDSRAGQPGMVWTLPFVLYGMLRYLHLVYRQDLGQNPNRLLFTDFPLLVSILGYLVVVTKVVYL
ncbi:MAG: decaprenyl-phosphate phosphoribosyltransferase [Planctomycetota bacterium]|nr:MAG: decaprenyl-phosphate phosphoribosyltransferase [Planctomycetota bacterium]